MIQGPIRERVAFYDAVAATYDRGITDASFWIALDGAFLAEVAAAAPAGGVAVEVGCGTGRLLPALARRFSAVVGVDWSQGMLREARTKAPAGVSLLAGDAARLPLPDGFADCVVIAGVLAYLDAPGAAVAEAARVLKPGGVLVGYENHRALLRPLFDLAMALAPSWTGKAWPPRATVSRRALEGWARGAGLVPRVTASVFLPPQAFNLLPPGAARRLLRASDAAARLVPGVRGQGGLLVHRCCRPDGKGGQ